MDTEDEQTAETEQAEPKGPKLRTPPYIAYKTLNNLLGDFKQHGLPPVIDRSVLTRFAGGLQGQIMLALKSLGLMHDDHKPTPRLATLVETYDTPQFKAELRKVVEATYPYVLKLDLNTATPGMFAGAFRDNLDAKEDVLRKCRTFFLNAARDVGIPIGPRIEKAKFPRGRINGPRKPKASKETPAANVRDPLPDDQQHDVAFMEKLLAKFPAFDPEWSEDIQKKWFAGFEVFMNSAKKGG